MDLLPGILITLILRCGLGKDNILSQAQKASYHDRRQHAKFRGRRRWRLTLQSLCTAPINFSPARGYATSRVWMAGRSGAGADDAEHRKKHFPGQSRQHQGSQLESSPWPVRSSWPRRQERGHGNEIETDKPTPEDRFSQHLVQHGCAKPWEPWFACITRDQPPGAQRSENGVGRAVRGQK